MVVFLFNSLIDIFLLLRLCILIVCLCIFIVPTGTLRLPWLRFFRAFSSVVRQMSGYNLQRQGTARTLPECLCCSIYCCFVSFCVLFLCKCVLYCCHRVATQLRLTNLSYILSYHIIYHHTNLRHWNLRFGSNFVPTIIIFILTFLLPNTKMGCI